MLCFTSLRSRIWDTELAYTSAFFSSLEAFFSQFLLKFISDHISFLLVERLVFVPYGILQDLLAMHLSYPHSRQPCEHR